MNFFAELNPFRRTTSVLLAAIVAISGLSSTVAYAEAHFTMQDGELQRPVGYREWVYVGTPVTPNDMNNGKAAFPEFHNVYIDPISWDHWK